MIYLLVVFLQCISAQGPKQKGLLVIGKNNQSYKVDGYSSYNNYVNNVETVLSEKIRDTYNFALQFTDKEPSVLLSQTTPDKLVFLQFLHSFDTKNYSHTNFLIKLSYNCNFPRAQIFRNWVDTSFDFPSKRIYEIIKYVANTADLELPKAILEQLFFLNIKHNIAETAVTKGDIDILKWLLTHSTSDKDILEFKTIEETWKNGKVEIIDLLMKYDKINKENLPQHIVNERFKNNETLLHIASRSGYINTINLLITNLKANVNSKDSNGKSPLCSAVENNKHMAVETLIANEADLSSEPLIALAVQKGFAETVKTLLKLGAPTYIKEKDGEPPYFSAVRKNNIKLLETLTNFEEAKKTLMNSTNDFGDTLLHVAASKGFIDSVKILAKFGAKIDVSNNLGETPLYKAVEGQNLEVINFLIKSGANRLTRTSVGDTIMHAAASLGNIKIIKLLISDRAGFPINARNSYGETPLYKAALLGKIETLKFLVENGGDLYNDNNGMKMLHEAVVEGNEKAVICLLDSGMNVNVTGFWDATPLHIAVTRGHERIVKRLLERSADPNCKTKNLWTPLHRAVLKENVNIIKLLISFGADGTIKNGAGETPYTLAKNNNKIKAMEMINSARQ